MEGDPLNADMFQLLSRPCELSYSTINVYYELSEKKRVIWKWNRLENLVNHWIISYEYHAFLFIYTNTDTFSNFAP